MQKILINQLPLASIAFLTDKIYEHDKKYISDDAGIIVDASILYAGDTTVAILNTVLTTIRKKSAFEQVVAEYASLHAAALKMVNYFTPLLPAEGGMPLLNKCLLNGIIAFNEAHKEHYLSNDPSIKIAAFIHGVSSTFHEILFNNIYGRHEDSWVQWKPLSEPVYYWLDRHGFKELLIVPTSTTFSSSSYNAASNKLLYEIFNFSDLNFCKISSAAERVTTTA